MTDAEQQSSPWLSVWLKPRVTIMRVLARHSTIQILVLAGLSTAFGFLVSIVSEMHLDLPSYNWHAVAVVMLGAGLVGIIGLYLAGFLFKIGGRLFGGRAGAAELRAVFAWGAAPSVVGLAVCFLALLGLGIAGVWRTRPQLPGSALQSAYLVFGLWSLVTTLLMLSRVQKFGFWRTVASCAVGYVLLLAVPLLVRVFLFEPFNAPSGSMTPTIVVGDYFFVSKYRYGYTRYSLPFSQPLFAGRIMGNQPKRGDILVYRQPQNPSLDFVKRLVGLPGDTIQVKAGVLYINGEPVPREPLGEYLDTETMLRRKRWRETLPDGGSYDVLDAGDSYLDNTEVYTVPAGRYFVMGDHRNNSVDSRMPESQGGGMVPYENLVGRVEVLFYSRDAARIGTVVR